MTTTLPPAPSPAAADGPGAAPRRGRLARRFSLDLVGPAGLFPLFVLLGLAAVERFDAQAFGVLGPEIRRTFHLSEGGFVAVFNLTTILPLFLAVFGGFIDVTKGNGRDAAWFSPGICGASITNYCFAQPGSSPSN